MAATGGSWFSANTLVHHGKVPAPTGARADTDTRNDPNTVVSFYDTVPKDDISLPHFEEWAIARLKTLKGMEQLQSQNKRDAELQSAVSKLLEKHMKVAGSAASTVQLDACSHFILRLAFCGTEENRKWLLARECDLFKHRYSSLRAQEKAAFLRQCDLPYPLATDEDIRTFRKQLSQVVYHTGRGRIPDNLTGQPDPLSVEELQEMSFRKVPFENVADLVGSRKVFLDKGMAYVPSDFLCSVLTPIFRQRLSRSLVMVAGRWATTLEDQENDRLAPILKALTSRSFIEESTATRKVGDGTKVSLADIPALSRRNFPLCMQHMYNTLQQERHLKHAARLQLGLFLKQAGLTLDESMMFWKHSFAPRTPPDKFDKEYAYNVRHSYGKEGSRKDYEAAPCMRIIASTPGVGEAHGCPFKTFEEKALRAALSRNGLPKGKISEAVELAKGNHYQRACDRTFEGLFGEAPEALIEHPNTYLAESVAIDKKRQGIQGGAAAMPSATPNGRVSMASNPVATPAQSAHSGPLTPFTVNSMSAHDQPFVRTPMNVTPTLGGMPCVSTPAAAGTSAGCEVATPSPVPSAVGGGTPGLAAPTDSPIAGLQDTTMQK